MKWAVWTCSGVSSALASTAANVGIGASAAYPFWVVDPESYPPFQVGVTVTSCSTSATAPAYNIEFSNDFIAQNIMGIGSSGLFASAPGGGFLGVSSTSATPATWFTLQSVTQGTTGLTGGSTFMSGIVLQPCTALRLNVTAGSTVQFVTVKLVQAG